MDTLQGRSPREEIPDGAGHGVVFLPLGSQGAALAAFLHARLENLIPQGANWVPKGAGYRQRSRPRGRDGRGRAAGGVSPLPPRINRKARPVPPPRANEIMKNTGFPFVKNEIIPMASPPAFVKNEIHKPATIPSVFCCHSG